MLMMPQVALAEDLSSTKLVTGLQKLIDDATSLIMGLAIPVTVLFVIYFLIRRSSADEQDQKRWGDRAKAAMVCGVGAIVAGGVIKAVAGYFQ